MVEMVKGAELLRKFQARQEPATQPDQVGLPKIDRQAVLVELGAKRCAPESPTTTATTLHVGPYTSVATNTSTATSAAISTKLEPATVVITVSGGGTGRGNPIFTFMDEIAPGALRLPYGARSMAKNTQALRAAIDSQLNQGNEVLVVGHSLGSIVAFNLVKHEYQGQPVTGIYVDPPYKTAFTKIPLLNLSPTFKAIAHATQDGIASDAGSVKWTDGKPFSHFLTHDAFDFPNHGNNQRNLSDLAEVIKARLN